MQSQKRKPIIPDGSNRSGTMVADVFDINTGRRRPIPLEDYKGMLDTLQKYFNEARRQRNDKNLFCHSIEILQEIRFNAQFSPKFREETRDELKAILDDMYEFVV